MTRKGMMGALDLAMVWGRRHYGREKPAVTNPEWVARAEGVDTIGVLVSRGADLAAARADLEDARDGSPDAVWLVKERDTVSAGLLDELGVEYLTLPSYRPYWGDHAPAWRDAELRWYANRILEFRPVPKTKTTHRRGRRPVGV